jgi:hypothetical protein
MHFYMWNDIRNEYIMPAQNLMGTSASTKIYPRVWVYDSACNLCTVRWIFVVPASLQHAKVKHAPVSGAALRTCNSY